MTQQEILLLPVLSDPVLYATNNQVHLAIRSYETLLTFTMKLGKITGLYQ